MRPIENKDELMPTIKKLLKSYSQQKVADMLGIGQNTVSRWLLEEKRKPEKPTGIKKKCNGCYQEVYMKFWGNYNFGGKRKDKYQCSVCKMVQSLEPENNPVHVKF